MPGRRRPRKQLTKEDHGLIRGLSQRGLSQRGIAKQVGCSQSAVSQHVRWHSDTYNSQTGKTSLRMLSESDEKLIADEVEQFGPVHNDDILRLAQQATARTISLSTARRALVSAGLTHYAQQQGPPIREEDKPKRVATATKLLSVLDETLFVDETQIGKLHVLAPGYWGRGPALFYHVPFPASLRSAVIGGMTTTRLLPLQFPVGTVTGGKFAPALEEVLQAGRRDGYPIKYIAMDNARIHGVSEVQDLLNTYSVSRIAMPPYSPDLNPIEHMWAWTKQAVGKKNYTEEFTSVAELDQAATALWESFDPQKVIKDFKQTLEHVISSNGEYTMA